VAQMQESSYQLAKSTECLLLTKIFADQIRDRKVLTLCDVY